MNAEEKFNAPVVLFYSYSHKDETYREELEKHLTTLRLSGLISDWHDRKILAGEEWDKKISEYLEKSSVILLLISSDFVASKYCYDIEAARALERYNKGEAILIPIILRPVKWDITPFGKIQALPKNAKPIKKWRDRDEAYLNICEGILALLKSAKSEAKDTTLDPINLTREKLLDVALPEQIAVGKTIALVVLIRGKDSEGLRKILRINTQYGVNEEDVISTGTFPLEFSVDESGKPLPLELNIKIESPDFEQSMQTKSIRILPDGDSEPRIFLLTPKTIGDLIVNLELYSGDDFISGCFLKTTASQNTPQNVSTNLASISINREFVQSSEEAATAVRGEGETQVDYGEGRQVDNRILTGIFPDRESAEKAYNSLSSRGYSKDEVSLLITDDTRNNYFSEANIDDGGLGSKSLETTGSDFGGTLGAVISGSAGVKTNVLLPRLGLIVSGPLSATLAGASRMTGGLVGALVDSGIPEDLAREYEEGIKNGGIVIGVTPRNENDADYFENEWRNHRGETIYR